LTFDLPASITGGRCEGEFIVRAGKKVLHSGDIHVSDLSNDLRTFTRHFELNEAGLENKDIICNSRGEIQVPLFAEPYPIQLMQGEKYDSGIEGVGFPFRIKEARTVDIEKKAYRKKEG
jgi:hypothetical protein